jgi:asparagine synthase (glutamine-hydrolysing)
LISPTSPRPEVEEMPGNPGELARRLRSAVATVCASERTVNLLYSGGLDSSTIAAARPDGLSMKLVTVGAVGSPDVEAAREGARWLGLPHLERGVDEADIASVLRRFRGRIDGSREPYRSVRIALALALEVASSPRVLCGQGADELFLGYAHFRGLSPEMARNRSELDLRILLDTEWPSARAMAHDLGHTLESPFLEPGFLSWARELPIDVHLFGAENKPLLRAAGRCLGLPLSLAGRPKKAIQYGSGIGRLTRRHFARDGDVRRTTVE